MLLYRPCCRMADNPKEFSRKDEVIKAHLNVLKGILNWLSLMERIHLHLNIDLPGITFLLHVHGHSGDCV